MIRDLVLFGLGLAAGLGLMWQRAKHWRRRADHWFNQYTDQSIETRRVQFDLLIEQLSCARTVDR